MGKELAFFPTQASTIAPQIDRLYGFLILLSIFFGLLIFGLIFYFSIKYRRQKGNETGSPVGHGVFLEIFWTVIPLLITVVIFVWGALIFYRSRQPPANAMEIFVTGKQWMWKIQHPSGNREINELHVPVGQPVKLTMTSEDVIHSFFVPAFRVKNDVLPGRYTSLWFEATKVGSFHLFCAEYCGTKHSQMIGQVVAMEPADYAEWLQGGVGQESLADAGRRLFSNLGCVTCHSNESGARGPSLAGILGKEIELGSGEKYQVDENYLRESILNPALKVLKGYAPLMPTYQGQVDELGLLRLLAYIKSLNLNTTSGGL